MVAHISCNDDNDDRDVVHEDDDDEWPQIPPSMEHTFHFIHSFLLWILLTLLLLVMVLLLLVMFLFLVLDVLLKLTIAVLVIPALFFLRVVFPTVGFESTLLSSSLKQTLHSL